MNTRAYIKAFPWVVLLLCAALVLWGSAPYAYVGAMIGMLNAVLGAFIYWLLR